MDCLVDAATLKALSSLSYPFFAASLRDLTHLLHRFRYPTLQTRSPYVSCFTLAAMLVQLLRAYGQYLAVT